MRNTTPNRQSSPITLKPLTEIPQLYIHSIYTRQINLCFWAASTKHKNWFAYAKRASGCYGSVQSNMGLFVQPVLVTV